MHVIYIQSGIKRPFTPIDQAIIRALRQLDVKVTPILPGKGMQQLLHAALKKKIPDCILVHMAWRLTKHNWNALQQVDAVPKLVWFTDDPYYLDWSRTVGSDFDIVFTNESRAIPVYRNRGCLRVHHLPLGADASQFYPRDRVPEKYRSDLLVLGTAFHNRRRFMQRVLPYLRNHKVRLVGPGWDQLATKRTPLIRIRPQWVSIKEANAYYNGAKIVLNLQRSPRDEYLRLNRRRIPAHTPNNRTFEVAACAAFQLVEARQNLSELYPSSARLLAFRTSEECVSMLEDYLPHVEERRRIAQKACRYTLSNHLYVHRLRTMLEHI